MANRKSKLGLNAETVRELTDQGLDGALGGITTGTTISTTAPLISCFTCTSPGGTGGICDITVQPECF